MLPELWGGTLLVSAPDVVVGVGTPPVIALGMWMLYRIASNHLNHLTEAIEGLTRVVERLDVYLREREDE